MKTISLIIYLFSTTCLAQAGYKIRVESLLSKKAKAFIVKASNIKLKEGVTVYIPFSKKKYCKATVQKVNGPLALIDSSKCKYSGKVKKGQRILVKRKIKRVIKRKQRFKKAYAKGPIFFKRGDLGSSTGVVTIPSDSRTNVGAKYIAESIFGEDCTLVLIKENGDSAVVDTAECPFERDLYAGQKFIPEI